MPFFSSSKPQFKRGLPAETQQDAVGAFFLDDSLDVFGGDWEKIHFSRQAAGQFE